MQKKTYSIHYRYKDRFSFFFPFSWGTWSNHKTSKARDREFVTLVKKYGHLIEFLRY